MKHNSFLEGKELSLRGKKTVVRYGLGFNFEI